MVDGICPALSGGVAFCSHSDICCHNNEGITLTPGNAI